MKQKISSEDEKQSLKDITSFIDSIHGFQKSSQVKMGLEGLCQVVVFNSSLISYLFTNIEHKFHNSPKFAIDDSFMSEDISLQENIQKALQNNARQLAVLNEAITQFSLTLSNKLTRALYDRIINPVRNNAAIKNTLLYGLPLSYFAYRLYQSGGHVGSDGKIFSKELVYANAKEFMNTSAQWVLGRLVLEGIAVKGKGTVNNFITNEFTTWSQRFTYLIDTIEQARGGVYVNKKSSESSVSFNDIEGNNELKDTFRRAIDSFMNPLKNAQNNIKPLAYPLLLGESGTGKSMFIDAFISELNQRYKEKGQQGPDIMRINSNGATLTRDGYTAMLNIGLGELIEAVKRTSMSTIFIIDEMHEVISSENKTLAVLLNFIGSSEKNIENPVFVIGATNHPEKLDAALLRDGRFTSFKLEYPSFDSRLAYAQKMITGFQYDFNDFKLEELMRYTDGKSYEALKNIINEAVDTASKKGQAFTQDHINASLKSNLFRIISSSKEIPVNQKYIVSSHMASQALALSLLKADVALSFATIELVKPHYTQMKDKPKYGAIFTAQPKDTIGMQSKEEQFKLCQFHLAGFAGEELLLGACGYTCHPEDKQKAFAIAQSIAYEGFDPAAMPKDLKDEKDKEAKTIMDTCQKQVVSLLSHNKAALERIVESLKEKGSLFDTDVELIIKQ